METILVILLGIWTLISGIAVTWRINRDFDQNEKNQNKKDGN